MMSKEEYSSLSDQAKELIDLIIEIDAMHTEEWDIFRGVLSKSFRFSSSDLYKILEILSPYNATYNKK